IVDLRAARGRRIELPGDAGRITIRDAAELRWVDTHVEPGAAATVYMPAARATGAAIDQRGVDGRIARHQIAAGDGAAALTAASAAPPSAARGPDELLAGLFDTPFGPHAFALWLNNLPHRSDEVYGVSSEDAERMRLLLAAIADQERADRHLRAGAEIAYGVTLGAASLVIEPGSSAELPVVERDSTTRTLALVGYAGFAALGLYDLLTSSQGERLYPDFVRGMADPAVDKARLVAGIERRLNQLADSRRAARHRYFGIGIAITVVSGGLLLTSVNWHANAAERANGRVALGAAAALGAVLALDMSTPGPTERMRGLWLEGPGRRT